VSSSADHQRISSLQSEYQRMEPVDMEMLDPLELIGQRERQLDNRPEITPYCYSHRHSSDEMDDGTNTFSQLLSTSSIRCGDICAMENTVAFNNGIAHSQGGDISEAIRCFEAAFTGAAQSYDVRCAVSDGERSAGPSPHAILHNIGHCHSKLGRHKEALSYYYMALDLLNKNTIYPYHFDESPSQLDISSTLNCIAIAQYHDPENADSTTMALLLEKALALRIEIPGEECSQETATMLYNLGRVKVLQRNFDCARRLFEDSIKIRRSLLGADHIDVFTIYFNLGKTAECQGRIPQAIEFYKHFLSFAISRKGREDKDVARTLILIGRLSYESNNNEDAHLYLSHGLVAAKLAFGANSIVVANTLNKIGNVFYCQNKFPSALEAYQAGLAIERQIHLPLDDNIAVTLLNVARVQQHQSEYSSALESYAEAYQIKNRLHDQESVAAILTNTGWIYDEQGDFAQAARVFGEAIQIRKQLEGGQNMALLSALLNALGLVQYKQGHIHPALDNLFEALEACKSDSESEETHIVCICYNIATTYKAIGDIDQALKYHKETLRLELKIHSQDRNNTVSADSANYTQIALLYREIGILHGEREEYDEANYHLQHASQMCIDNPTLIDRDCAFKTLKSLGDLQMQMDDDDLAMRSYANAVSMFNHGTIANANMTEVESSSAQNDILGWVSDYLDYSSCLLPPAAAAA